MPGECPKAIKAGHELSVRQFHVNDFIEIIKGEIGRHLAARRFIVVIHDPGPAEPIETTNPPHRPSTKTAVSVG